MKDDMLFENVLKYLLLLEKDKRLNVWHFALLTAILYLAVRQGQDGIIKVSRRRIMSLSHIGTFPTYHKYFRELQEFGYIVYTPSYHPGYKSEIKLIIKP